jgi:hypothetical protein
MAAAAHDPGFARRAGVPVSVAREFNRADAGTGILSGRTRKGGSQREHVSVRRGRAAGHSA